MAERLETEGLGTGTLPVLPLTSGVVLPQMVVTLALETDEARAAADAASEAGGELLLVPRFPDGGRYGRVGTVATIENRGTLPGGTPALVVRALRRAHVGAGVIGTSAALWVHTEPVDDEPPSTRATELAGDVRAVISALFDRLGGRRLTEVLKEVTDPAQLADLAGWWPDLAFERKVELLETVDVEARLERVLEWSKEALAELEVSDQIRKDVSEGIEKNQREFLLRQQMSAIRKELGEDGDDEELVDDYRAKLAVLVEKHALTDAAASAIEREVGRLERTPAQNMEHGWIRTWLDTVFEIPWGETTTDDLDIGDARRILDEDHTGLEEVKERIVEFLAVRKLRADRGLGDADAGEGAGSRRRGAGAILALVGPPGVGKTSLGESVARALGRKFVRVALGGVRDEAEIRGHRRTYIGSLPGRVIQSLRRAGSRNPVFLLDEVDKLGADFRGDPASALLEVLDPEQNHTFNDHYLEVDFDLSQVMFICTANSLYGIPAPLQDRMEIIRLPGYLDTEKVQIARRFLVPKQRAAAGLSDDDFTISPPALEALITRYTREAGVRNLERELASICRKCAVEVVKTDRNAHVKVSSSSLAKYLGVPK
ncbi:MAG TPA: AAA family ATPase, partial [Acidimicrobiales bacterium]|nr:AAA family ATPase [Acidimicrobiales bacterium]